MNQHNVVFPETSIVKSGTGGFHLYYKNTSGKKLWGAKNVIPGVDVRAENAYIVAPPSIHRNRKKYEWIQGNLEDIAEVDESVIRFLDLIPKNKGELKYED